DAPLSMLSLSTHSSSLTSRSSRTGALLRAQLLQLRCGEFAADAQPAAVGADDLGARRLAAPVRVEQEIQPLGRGFGIGPRRIAVHPHGLEPCRDLRALRDAVGGHGDQLDLARMRT